MSCRIDAYLDIETTGLSAAYHDITVVGIYLVNGSDSRLVQLVGEHVKKKALIEALDGVHTPTMDSALICLLSIPAWALI